MRQTIDMQLASLNVAVDDIGGAVDILAFAKEDGYRSSMRRVFPRRSAVSFSSARRSTSKRSLRH